MQVKLLLDADGSRYLTGPRSAAARRRLRAALLPALPVVPARQYNHRTHRKLLVIDGVVGFTGGIGVADMWSGRRPGWR